MSFLGCMSGCHVHFSILPPVADVHVINESHREIGTVLTT